MPPKYEDLINVIENQLKAAFDKKDPSGVDLSGLCQKYILVNGMPLLPFTMKRMTDDDMFKKTSAIILKALVNNQDVSWAKPEERTNAFKVSNMTKFPVPKGLKKALENKKLKADIEKNLETAIPVSAGIEDKALLEETINTSAYALEKLTTMDIAPFFKGDLLRDVINDPENGGIQNGIELLNKLTDKDVIKFRFERNSFESHALAMLINEGHTPEEIFDPSEEGIKLRAQAGKRIYKLAKEKNVDELLRINIEGTQNIGRIVEKRIRKIDYSDEANFYKPENLILEKLIMYDMDLSQERELYPKKCPDIHASLEGKKITTEEERKEYKNKEQKNTKAGFAYTEIYTMMQTKQRGFNYILGLLDPYVYDELYLSGVFRGYIAKSLITEAIKKGEPIREKLTNKIINSLVNSKDLIYSSTDGRGKEIFKEISKKESPKDRVAFIKSVEDGTFAKSITVGHNYKEDGTINPIIFKNPVKDMFFSKKCQMPTDKDVADKEAERHEVDSALKSALENQFGMSTAVGNGPQYIDRLYFLDSNNKLTNFGSVNFVNAKDMQELRKYLFQGKLFAVKENEATPVQLGVSKDKNNWICSASECLDNEPEPVEYKWYHKFGAFLGIKSQLARKAAFEDYSARLAVKNAVVEKKEDRERVIASLSYVVKTLEKAEETARQKKLDKIVELSAKNAAELKKYPQDAADVIKKGNEAIETLQKAELDNLYIEREKRLQLVKDVVKSNLVQVFTAQAGKVAANNENPSPESKVVKALVDPKTGDDSFKQIFEAIYPDNEKFLYMQPKYLVEAVNNVKKDIVMYQEKLGEQLEKSNKKEMNAPKLDNPQIENIQPVKA